VGAVYEDSRGRHDGRGKGSPLRAGLAQEIGPNRKDGTLCRRETGILRDRGGGA
jgi:hypothetical protein